MIEEIRYMVVINPLNAKTIYIYNVYIVCSRVPVSQREDHIHVYIHVVYVKGGERSLSRLFIFIA